MPLSEEQRKRLQSRMGQGVTHEATSAMAPTMPGTLPPEIQEMVSQMPQGQPYLKSLGSSGPQIGFPLPQAEIALRLGMKAAEQKVKAMTPQASDTTKRDFARIDAFEGILNDLEAMSKDVRKGPIQGRYVTYGSKATGGSKFGDVSEQEAINAVNYSDMRPGVAAGLYRAITGDDRISDRDAAQRALPFVPDLSLQPKAFARRMQLVRRAIARKRQSIRKSVQMGGTVQDSSSIFADVMSQALDEHDND